MNLTNILAAQYLWEYHEPFVVTAMHWVVGIVIYGGIALAIGSAVWKGLSVSANKPSPGNSSIAPAKGMGQTIPAVSPAVHEATDPSCNVTEETRLPSDLLRVIPDADAAPTIATASIAATDASERLQKLNRLRDQGLVSSEIYEAKRQQILQTL